MCHFCSGWLAFVASFCVHYPGPKTCFQHYYKPTGYKPIGDGDVPFIATRYSNMLKQRNAQIRGFSEVVMCCGYVLRVM